jgi:excisionase family DNA binding protein
MAMKIRNPPAPSEADSTLARESLRQLSRLPGTGSSDLRIRVTDSGEDITLPASAFRLLKDFLAELAQGHEVALVPVASELTTQQAADLLNVSRPYLIGLLENGTIPFRRVGQHRRVRLQDLMIYKRKDDETRGKIAADLTSDAQELGLGY